MICGVTGLEKKLYRGLEKFLGSLTGDENIY